MKPSSDSARQINHLLGALPSDAWPSFASHLEWLALPQGQVLHEAGAVLQQVYFPATATLSLVSSMRDGASAEVAVVGREGLAGVCAFLGSGYALSGAVVQAAGYAWRMPADTLRDQVRRSPALMQPLLSYTQTLLIHMAQASACHRHHGVEKQLCRWLLLHLDRCAGDELLITHERIAAMLGVRREGVTKAALDLQGAGVLRGSRGRIGLLDRAGLEGRCCECYAVVRLAYDRLRDDRAADAAAATLRGRSRGAWPGAYRDRRLPAPRLSACSAG